MKWIWNIYKMNGFGYDEVKPISGEIINDGLSTFLIDSLDTLWLYDMKDEFYEARDYVRDKLNFNNVNKYQSTFEITIRILGGLLSAYYLSNDDVFKNKAIDLGDRLILAFINGNGIPIVY